MLWNEHGIGLVGRSSLVRGKIQPVLNSPAKRFVLKGEPGVGKTALLEAAFELCQGKKAFVSGASAIGEICKKIITAWEIEVESEKKTPTVAEMKTAVLKQSGNALFADDLQRATPKLLDFLKVLSERNRVHGAMRSCRMKEDLKQFLIGSQEIRIKPLAKNHSLELAQKLCVYFGSEISHKQIATASGGLPFRIVKAAQSGEIQHDEQKLKSEEIDISPLLGVALIGVMLFRYFGRAIGDSSDLVLLGGVGLILAVIGRGILYKGKER